VFTRKRPTSSAALPPSPCPRLLTKRDGNFALKKNRFTE